MQPLPYNFKIAVYCIIAIVYFVESELVKLPKDVDEFVSKHRYKILFFCYTALAYYYVSNRNIH